MGFSNPLIITPRNSSRLPEDIDYEAWTADPATWQTTANTITTGDLVILRMDNLKRNGIMSPTGGLTLHVVGAGSVPGNLFAALFAYPVAGVCTRYAVTADLSANIAGGGLKIMPGVFTVDGGQSLSQNSPAVFLGILIGTAWTTNPTFRSIGGDSAQAHSGRMTAGTDLLYASRVATGLTTMPTSFNVSAMGFGGGQTFGAAIF